MCYTGGTIIIYSDKNNLFSEIQASYLINYYYQVSGFDPISEIGEMIGFDQEKISK